MNFRADEGEIWRHLGFRNGATPDSAVQKRIRDVAAEVEAAAVPRYLSQPVTLRWPMHDTVELGTIQIQSRDLARHLSGCGQAMLFAATLGIQVDQLISRAAVRRITDAAIAQAVAAVLIEVYSDAVCDAIGREAAGEGWHLRPRFSPGYGDFPMEYQRNITEYLQTPKNLGLTVTDSLLLVPMKSITAVIGMAHTVQPCTDARCDACEKTDCLMRRR